MLLYVYKCKYIGARSKQVVKSENGKAWNLTTVLKVTKQGHTGQVKGILGHEVHYEPMLCQQQIQRSCKEKKIYPREML